MGIVGKYLDTLDDAARDRIITHPDPTYDGQQWRCELRGEVSFGCACMVGAAEQVPECVPEMANAWHAVEQINYDTLRAWLRQLPRRAHYAGQRFPELADRFGAPRIWRLVKARAAKGHTLPVAAQQARQPEPVA